MIISQAPCRIGLFGGGTDLPSFAEKYGGVVINMAINIRQHITWEENSRRKTYLNIPDKASEKFYEAFHEGMNYWGTNTYLESKFDGIIESGLGSSASCAVALVGAFLKAQGKDMTKMEIAEKAWDIEVNKLKLFGGKQDQMAASFGGMNLWKFNGDVTRQSFNRDVAEKLSKQILLFYTGHNRKSSKIQENLKELSKEQVEQLKEIKQITHNAYKFIYKEQYNRVGGLLDLTWKNKKKVNPQMTTPKIDKLYDLAIDKGAWGGKLCGSGGGGFIFFIADRANHSEIIKALETEGAKWYDFSIDYQGVEVRILP